MREFTVENNGANTNLVYEIQAADTIDTVALGMMENNKIAGLLPMIYTQMDADRLLKYNITSKVTMNQLFERSVTKERIVKCFTNIIDALYNAEEYMLDMSSFLIDMKYIYVNVSTLETELLCMPIIENAQQPNMEMFFKNIIFSAQFDQSENCDYVAKLISYLNSGSFALGDFKNVLDELLYGKKPQQQEAAASVEQPAAASQPEVKTIVDASSFGGAPSMSAPVPPVQMAPATPAMPAMGMPKPAAPTPAMPVMPADNAKEDKKAKKAREKMEKEQAKKEKKGGLFSNKEKAPKAPAAAPSGMAIPGMAIPGAPTPAPGNNSMPAPKAVPPMGTPSMPAPSNPQMPGSVSAPTPMPAMAPMPQATFTQTSGNFGETTVLGASAGIGETTVLGVGGGDAAAYAPKPYLIRKKNNEKVFISKSVFKIGKENSYVDYFIGDNTAVSRSHASIIVKGDNYYIMDTNSKNHTYVDGNMIQPNLEVPMKPGMKIRLADEEFEFVMQ